MYKVLIVDDEPFIREGLKRLIDWNQYGFSVCGEAEDGKEGLEAIGKLNPDLVITDIRMPQMDGLEMIRRSVLELKAEARYVILSGYQDFSYARTAIKYNVGNYILKPVDPDELIETLIQTGKDIEEDIKRKEEKASSIRAVVKDTIARLLNGDTDSVLLKQYEEWLGIKDGKPAGYVLIELDDFAAWMNELEEDVIKARLEHFKKTLIGVVGKENSLNIIEESLFRYGVIINADILKLYHDDKQEFCRIMHRNLNEQNRTRISVYIGKTAYKASELVKSYQSCLHAMEWDFYSGGGAILYADDLQQESRNDKYYEDLSVSVLLNKVDMYDLDGIAGEVRHLFAELYRHNYALEVIKACVINLALEIVKLISGRNGNIENYMERIGGMYRQNMPLRKLQETFIRFCQDSGMDLKKLKEAQSTDVLFEIEKYIKRNYNCEISLKSISEQFFLNPIYLGQLFKKKYGIYFNDFLNDLRIKESMQLLKQTEMKIYEVAARVGYADSDYFIKNFIKINGISPMQYKKTHRLE